MDSTRTASELEAELGGQLRGLRLRRNIDQRTLAAQAGVALNVVKNLEAGRGATTASLIKVLRALGRADWLGTLSPPVSISPIRMLKSKPARQRVSRSRGAEHV